MAVQIFYGHCETTLHTVWVAKIRPAGQIWPSLKKTQNVRIVFFAFITRVAAAFNARCSVAVTIPYVVRVSGVPFITRVAAAFNARCSVAVTIPYVIRVSGVPLITPIVVMSLL